MVISPSLVVPYIRPDPAIIAVKDTGCLGRISKLTCCCILRFLPSIWITFQISSLLKLDSFLVLNVAALRLSLDFSLPDCISIHAFSKCSLRTFRYLVGFPPLPAQLPWTKIPARGCKYSSDRPSFTWGLQRGSSVSYFPSAQLTEFSKSCHALGFVRLC